MRARLPRFALRAFASAVVVAAAFLGAAWLGRTPPFESRTHDPFSETSVMRALPFDAPIPHDMALVASGRGDDLAYHAQWSADESVAEVTAAFQERLAGSPKWQITHAGAGPAQTATLVRVDSYGYMTHFAHVSMERELEQTFFTVEFTPIPTANAPQ